MKTNFPVINLKKNKKSSGRTKAVADLEEIQ
jgi:hypothetical protein